MSARETEQNSYVTVLGWVQDKPLQVKNSGKAKRYGQPTERKTFYMFVPRAKVEHPLLVNVCGLNYILEMQEGHIEGLEWLIRQILLK